MTRFLYAAVLAIPAAAAAGDDAALKKELKVFEGSWKAVAAAAGGKNLPKCDVPPVTFVVRADGTTTGLTPGGETTATLTVDPFKTPKTLDIVHGGGAFKGLTQYVVPPGLHADQLHERLGGQERLLGGAVLKRDGHPLARACRAAGDQTRPGGRSSGQVARRNPPVTGGCGRTAGRA